MNVERMANRTLERALSAFTDGAKGVRGKMASGSEDYPELIIKHVAIFLYD